MAKLQVLFALLATVGCGGSSPSIENDRDATEGAERPDPIRLKLASAQWAPFVDHDARARIAVDLVLTGLARGGVEVETEILDAATNTDELLRSDDYDGAFAVWKSPERQEHLRFSTAYLENRLVLVGRVGADVSATEPSEIPRDQRVGVVAGYAYGEDLSSGGAVVVPGESTEANFRALLANEVDYVLAENLVVHQLFDQHPERAPETFVVGAQPVIQRSLHFAIDRTHPRADAIVDAFDEAIAAMLRDGAYHDVLQLRWIEADVDEDGAPEYALAGVHAGVEAPLRIYRPLPGGFIGGEDTPYFVDGVQYPSWDAIPDRYRVASPGDGVPRSVFRYDIF